MQSNGEVSRQSEANSVSALVSQRRVRRGGEETRETVSVPCTLLVGYVDQGTST